MRFIPSAVFSPLSRLSAAARILLYLLAFVSAARAHPGGLQNPLKAEIGPDKITVTVWVSITELGVLGGVPIDKLSGTVDMAALEDAAPRHDAYLLSHLTFQADNKTLEGKVVNLIPPSDIGQGPAGPDNAHYRYQIDYPCLPPPRRLFFTHQVGADALADDGSPWNVTYTVQFSAAGQSAPSIGRVPPGAEFIYLPGSGTVEVVPQAEPLPRRPGEELRDAAARAGVSRGVRHPALWALAATLALTSAGALSFLRRWLLLLGGAAAGAALLFWLRETIPPWLPSPLIGVAALLAGADAIHDPGGAFALRRRLIFLLGGAAAGMALAVEGLSIVRENEAALAVQGASAYAAGALAIVTVVSLLFAESLQRVSAASAPSRRVLIQFGSLAAVCAAGLHVLISMGLLK